MNRKNIKSSDTNNPKWNRNINRNININLISVEYTKPDIDKWFSLKFKSVNLVDFKPCN
jgi:hypothetical protein